MKGVGDSPPLLDFGTIQPDMSLVTNMFPVSIPQRDYMVCRSATWDEIDDALQPGDRVLVAWVGNDACVIDLILPATAIQEG